MIFLLSDIRAEKTIAPDRRAAKPSEETAEGR